MAKLQAAMDDWYSMELTEGQADKRKAIHIQDNDEHAKVNAAGDAKINEAKDGLGQPKDGGKAAQKKQEENSAKDAKEKGNKGKSAQVILKEKIAKLLKELEDCEKKCPPPEKVEAPTPTPTTEEKVTPTPTPGNEVPPPPVFDIKIPQLPPCFGTERDREKYRKELEEIVKKLELVFKKYDQQLFDPPNQAWQDFKNKFQKAKLAVSDQNFPGDDGKDKIDKVEICKGGGTSKPTPTPKGKPIKAPRVTTGGNVSYGGGPMEDFCTEISDNKIKVDITGTGETIGHIADARISNLTDEPIAFTIPPAVLESHSGKNQNYGVPHTTDVALKPHEAKTVPLDGVCLDRHKPPVGKGIGDDLAFNDCDPDGRIPHDRSDRMLRIAETVYQAADKLEEDGKLKEIPYKDPKKRKEIVEQWATWVRISEVTGDPPPTKDDLKKVVGKQVGKVPPDKQKKIDEGIDTIFEKIELTTEKAKDLDKTPSEEASPANTGENISDDTPTPPPQTTEKKKDKKDKKGKAKGPPGKWPNPVKDWWLKLVAAEGADYKKEAAQDAYKTKLADYFKQNKHHEDLVDKINKAQGKLSNPLGSLTTEQADKLIKERDDAKKELATLESQLEKDFQKTDDGKKARVEKGDAEKAADDAHKAEQEAGKYLDKDAIGDHMEELMKSAKEEAEKEMKIPATP